MTKKSVYTIYVLAICLICVITSTALTASVLYNLFGSAAPQYTISQYNYATYATNDRFLEDLEKSNPCHNNEKLKCKPLPTKVEDITAQREKRLAEELEQQQHRHIKDIIENIPYLILFLLVGFFHWRLFRTIKE